MSVFFCGNALELPIFPLPAPQPHKATRATESKPGRPGEPSNEFTTDYRFLKLHVTCESCFLLVYRFSVLFSLNASLLDDLFWLPLCQQQQLPGAGVALGRLALSRRRCSLFQRAIKAVREHLCLQCLLPLALLAPSFVSASLFLF